MGARASAVKIRPSTDQKDTNHGPLQDLANMLISLSITDDDCLRFVRTLDKNAKTENQIKLYRYPKYTNNCSVVLSEAACGNTLLHLAVSNDKRHTAVEIAERVPELVFECIVNLKRENAAFILTPLGIAAATNPILAIELIGIAKNRKAALRRIITGCPLKCNNDSSGVHEDSAARADKDASRVHKVSAGEGDNNSARSDKDSAGVNNNSTRVDKLSAGGDKDSAREDKDSARVNTYQSKEDKVSASADKDSARGDNISARVDKDSARGDNISARRDKDSSRGDNISARGDTDSARGDNISARGDTDSARGDKDSARGLWDKDSAKGDKVSAKVDKDSSRSDKDSFRLNKDSNRMDKDTARRDTDSARVNKESATMDKDSATAHKVSARLNNNSAILDKDSTRVKKDSSAMDNDPVRLDEDSDKLDNVKKRDSVEKAQPTTILGGTVLMGQLPLHIAVLNLIAKQYVKSQAFQQVMKDTQDTNTDIGKKTSSQQSGSSTKYKKLNIKTAWQRSQYRERPQTTANRPRTGKQSKDHEITRDNFEDIKQLMVKLKKYGASVGNRNYIGDTVFHSILRFVNCFPEKENVAVKVMEYLIRWAIKDGDTMRKILWTKNNDEVTVLQLAVDFGHTKVFSALMKVKGLYYHSDNHYEELYEMQTIDVTEFDKPTMWHAWKTSLAFQGRSSSSDGKAVSKDNTQHERTSERIDQKSYITKTWNSIKEHRRLNKQQSIIELLCSSPHSAGVEMVGNGVFEAIMERKWPSYRWSFSAAFLIHVVVLTWLSVYTIAKAHVIVGDGEFPVAFVTASQVLAFLIALVYFLQEVVVRCWFARQPFSCQAVHHNAVYRVFTILFSLLLIGDSVSNIFVLNNYGLIIALVIGTWNLLFFLRKLSFFSIYVVLINEALFTVVGPFAVLAFMQVLIFSVGMHATFLLPENNSSIVEDFNIYGKSVLNMGKLMVGLPEFTYLLNSKDDVIALLLFGVFIVITFLLLINGLVAAMTNGFADLQKDKIKVEYIQKLSIIVFMEAYSIISVPAVSKKDMEQYHIRTCPNRKHTPECQYNNGRYVMSYRKVPDNISDDPNRMVHKLRDGFMNVNDTLVDIQNRLGSQDWLLRELYETVERKSETAHVKMSRPIHIYHFPKGSF